MTAPETPASELQGLASACGVPDDGQGLAGMLERIHTVLPEFEFSLVLSRGGWHRIGGVVDGDYGRVAENIDLWAGQVAGGDVSVLIDRYAGAGYFATRWQGMTHYLTAPLGGAAGEFVQLEIEELQEVLDRFLIDPDWYPDDLEEFLDPLDYPRLEPEPVGPVRYVFRRLVRIPQWREQRQPEHGAGNALPRLFADWDRSSAGAAGHFCRHWILALRESTDRAGGIRLSGRPVPGCPRDGLPAIDTTARGASLANQLHAFDRAAGYPFAWYFHMLCTTGVGFEVGEAALADLAEGFDYLPQRDAEVLRRWAAARYAP